MCDAYCCFQLQRITQARRPAIWVQVGCRESWKPTCSRMSTESRPSRGSAVHCLCCQYFLPLWFLAFRHFSPLLRFCCYLQGACCFLEIECLSSWYEAPIRQRRASVTQIHCQLYQFEATLETPTDQANPIYLTTHGMWQRLIYHFYWGRLQRVWP